MILCACVAFLLFLTCVYMPSLTGSETCLNLQSKHLSLGSVASLSPFIHYLALSRTHSMYTCVCAAQDSVTCAGDLKSCNKHAASEESCSAPVSLMLQQLEEVKEYPPAYQRFIRSQLHESRNQWMLSLDAPQRLLKKNMKHKWKVPCWVNICLLSNVRP